MGRNLNRRIAKQWKDVARWSPAEQPELPAPVGDEGAWPPKAADDHSPRRDDAVVVPHGKLPRP